MRWTLIALLGAVSSCAALGIGRYDGRARLGDGTVYVPENSSGLGYSDEMLSPLTFRVTFSMAKTAAGARQGAFWRAAEIARDRGFASFALVQQRGESTEITRGGGLVCNHIGASTICSQARTRTSRRPGATVVVRMLRSDDAPPDGALVYVATQILAEIPGDH